MDKLKKRMKIKRQQAIVYISNCKHINKSSSGKRGCSKYKYNLSFGRSSYACGNTDALSYDNNNKIEKKYAWFNYLIFNLNIII